jgi:hypothetical protein
VVWISLPDVYPTVFFAIVFVRRMRSDIRVGKGDGDNYRDNKTQMVDTIELASLTQAIQVPDSAGADLDLPRSLKRQRRNASCVANRNVHPKPRLHLHLRPHFVIFISVPFSRAAHYRDEDRRIARWWLDAGGESRPVVAHRLRMEHQRVRRNPRERGHQCVVTSFGLSRRASC